MKLTSKDFAAIEGLKKRQEEIEREQAILAEKKEKIEEQLEYLSLGNKKYRVKLELNDETAASNLSKLLDTITEINFSKRFNEFEISTDDWTETLRAILPTFEKAIKTVVLVKTPTVLFSDCIYNNNFLYISFYDENVMDLHSIKKKEILGIILRNPEKYKAVAEDFETRHLVGKSQAELNQEILNFEEKRISLYQVIKAYLKENPIKWTSQ